MTAPPSGSDRYGPVSRPAALALALISLGAAALFALYWTPHGADDPWITYRYAENLAAGRGWVYNLGERVMGNSTPLYTLLLAGARLLGLSVPLVSWVIGFLGLLAAPLLLFLLVRRLHSEAAGVLAAGLLASAQLFHRVATYGMETPLYVVLILAAFLAYASGRELLAAALAAACLLTRLDGAAVGVSLMAAHLATRRTFPWRAAVVYVAIAAPWFVFAQAYFDSLVPNSMIAKRLHTQHTMLGWMPRWLAQEPRAPLALIGLVAAIRAGRARPATVAVGIWGVAYAAAYSLSSIQRYDWYQTPLLAGLAGGAAIGVVALAGLARSRRAAWSVAVALTAVLMLPDGIRTARRLGGDLGPLGVEQLRFAAAHWLRDSLPPGEPLAVGGIGMVGYFTGRQIYDAMGLVTPGSMRIEEPIPDPRLVPYPRFLPAVIADHRPRYVFDAFWLPPGRDMPDFMQGQYEIVREWRGSNPRWPRFILYRRAAPLDSIRPVTSPRER